MLEVWCYYVKEKTKRKIASLTSDKYSTTVVWVSCAPPVLLTFVHSLRWGKGVLLFFEKAFGQAAPGILVVFPLLQFILESYRFHLCAVPDLHSELIFLDLHFFALCFSCCLLEKGKITEHQIVQAAWVLISQSAI